MMSELKKIAEASRAEALMIARAARAAGVHVKIAVTVGKEVKSPGILRTTASSAWKIGGTPAKPKSIKPNTRLGSDAKTRAAVKPPSNRAYHKDALESLYNPQRGYRLSVVK